MFSISNTQLLTDALVNYTSITGTDLSKVPKLKHSSSSGAVLQLLQEREKAFKEYRDSDPRLISCLTPVVNILWAFSPIHGQEVKQVSDISHLVSLLT